MMAFFLLMWLLGATTEKQRKGLADYFTPTLVQLKMDSAGSAGLFGGDSITSRENYPTTGGQGNATISIPRDATGTRDVGGDDMKDRDRQKFEQLKRAIEDRLSAEKALRKLRRHIRFTETNEGLRIDLIDQADFAMFKMGTATLLPEARALITQVAHSVAKLPNAVIVRGHTDGLPYSAGQSMNNWMLSTARAESTRALLAQSGISPERFARIEGVADREPFAPEDRYDPRNRRMSVVLAWSREADKALGRATKPERPDPAEKAAINRRIALRDNPLNLAAREMQRLDLGHTALPPGAKMVNGEDIPQRDQSTPPGRTEATTRDNSH
jgi:chemotaxis protein MotB